MSPNGPQRSPPSPSNGPRRRGTTAIVLTLLGVLTAYAATGFCFVQPDERGVVRWLGHVPGGQRRPPYGAGPGLHYAPPWPVCRVDVPKTTEVRQLYVGMPPELREAIAQGETWAMRASSASDVFTSDVNILKVTMAVHYKVANPVAYLLVTEDPDELVRLTVQGVLIEELGKLPVDEALTTAKSKLENDTRARSQTLLDAYGCGVRLIATNLESIGPARAIASAFKDVVSAKKDGEKVTDQAIAEANRSLPRARGDAAEVLEEAQAYYQARVSRARGETDRFLNLLVEYRRAPDVTADRLRLQTFEKVLAKVRKVIVDNKPGEEPTRIRIIDVSPE
ncbi:MAG: FtsH protease activity modulator HflK [Phycisphaerae bacterium]